MNEAARERMHNQVFLSSLSGLLFYIIIYPALKRWAIVTTSPELRGERGSGEFSDLNIRRRAFATASRLRSRPINTRETDAVFEPEVE